MALIEKLNSIGDAIRAKTGGTKKLTLDEMPNEIGSIETGANPIIQDLVAKENGVYVPEGDVDGFSPVTVNVPIPDGYIKPSGDVSITENGEYDVTEKARAVVAVPEDHSAEDSIITRGISRYVNPRVTAVGAQTFYGCSKLKFVFFAKAESIGSNSFRGCTVLKTAIFPKAETINANAFNGDSALVTLILGGNGLCKLGASTALASTPISTGTGNVYVRTELVEGTRSASYWSSVASQIMPLVSTVEELAGIDGTVYDRACVWNGGEEYTEYYFDSVNQQWGVLDR